MEPLIAEIEAYAKARGLKPATVLQYAAGLSGTSWEKWKAGAQVCTVATAEKIRAFIMDNPPVQSGSGSLACESDVGDERNDCKGGAA
jgi:hypothetical protein